MRYPRIFSPHGTFGSTKSSWPTLFICPGRKTQQSCVRSVFSPLHVHRGDIEVHSFQPQHHEQPLGEGTVADALTIVSRLEKRRTCIVFQSCDFVLAYVLMHRRHLIAAVFALWLFFQSAKILITELNKVMFSILASENSVT